MCGCCLACCTGVVLNTVRESATPDSKENKQVDAGSRRFRRHFLCGALLCNFSSTEHEGLSTHVERECSAVLLGSIRKTLHDESVKVLSTQVQRECSAEPSMRRILRHEEIFHVSPVLVNDYWSRCKFSALTSTPLYSSKLYAQKVLCSQLFKKAWRSI